MTSQRRHCMVVYAYYPLAETRVQRQAEALVAAGYAVDVICLRAPGERPRERYRGVDVYRMPIRLEKRGIGRRFASYARFFALAACSLTARHLRRAYHTVQVHNLPDFLVFCAVVPKLFGVPVILDLHDLMPEFFVGRFGPSAHPTLQRLIRWQERNACRFADHVITVSDHWRSSLIERGVPEEKCSVVMNVADQRIFISAGRTARRAGSHLLYHGTVVHRYGLDIAIRGVDLARRTVPAVRLTILGRGEAFPSLRALCATLGLERHVELVEDLVPAERLPPIIDRVDIGIVPYRNDPFTDGLLPTKLMEYAAMGVPCIAARTTAIHRYFQDAMVEFFDPGDAEDLARCIRKLASDPGRVEALSRRSVVFTQRYDWRRIGERYVALVRGLGDEGATPDKRGSRRSLGPFTRHTA